jgi:chromosome partitioning protein
MEGLAQFIQTIDRIRASLNPRLAIEGGLITMFDQRMVLNNQVRDEVAKYFGEKMLATIIPRNIRLAEAPGFGQPITLYDHKSRGAQAYLELAKEFLARRPGSAPAIEKAALGIEGVVLEKKP